MRSTDTSGKTAVRGIKEFIMFRLGMALALIITIEAIPSTASANTGSFVLISEVQTGGALSASQEFVELYNRGVQDLEIEGWSIEYKPASSADIPSSWSKKASLSGVVRGHSFFLAAPKMYFPSADAEWTSAMAGTSGHIRVKDDAGRVVDLLGYGDSANSPEGASALAPPAGQSLERLPGWIDAYGGNGLDSNNNKNDFLIRTNPEPQSLLSLGEVYTGEVPPPIDEETEAEEPAQDPIMYAPIEITEILPDPLSPLTDAEDEFIELYNPTDESVNLEGYILKAGSTYKSSYVLGDREMAPNSYIVIYSSLSKLSLSNSGGGVQLIDPGGSIIDASMYDKALSGQAWAKFDSGWMWTMKLTPNSPNEFILPVVSAAKPKITKPKTASVKKKAAPKKPKAAKPKKAKKPKAKKIKFPTKVAAATSLKPANWLLISLAILTIGYAAYEFRYDIQNLYYKLRGHKRLGGQNGPPS